ncbi:MAG: VCBS repeat-containing protein [Bacteroidota bacterium]
MRKITFLCLVFLYFGCSRNEQTPPLFQLLPAEKTGINFSNDLTYADDFNPYIFKNFFNGGGAAVGDLNKDGLADLFFCGNMVDNKLYLNRGNFQFEDITAKAGVASQNVWSSGVSFADVNGDGWLDIYVCKSGKPGGELRYNELFINQGVDENGDLRFVEMAKVYGIADEGLSAHAAFFDYDKDGDLDMYLLNNSLRPVGGFDIRPGLREIRDPFGGNKLYRNELISESRLSAASASSADSTQPRFTDVSEQAGIYGSNIGYGLGVTIGDVNKDGWQDIHISNDFFERDYLYINQKDGTFKEDLTNQITEISSGSMGADMADINNDGYPEIFVTDMLPETEDRYKSKMTFDNWNKYQLNVKNGYYHQFTRNVLQLNNKNGTFSEISRLAGVHATDWSWSALLADLNNDGYKDIYVTNGIYQDLMDQDYINYYATDPKIITGIRNREEGAILRLLEKMPSNPIPNYVFRNNGDLTFTKKTNDWGLAAPSFSNGAAYGDLDNDGDLDLVVNNVNMPAFVYENQTNTLLENNYLTLKLTGKTANPFALGAQITLRVKGKTFYQELVTSKGFQSSVDYKVHFGLGAIEQVDELEIKWPAGNFTVLKNVAANQLLELSAVETKDKMSPPAPTVVKPIFSETTDKLPIDFEHRENNYNDFNRDQLLHQMISAEGPAVAKGDINQDGLMDLFIGGSKGQSSVLLKQTTAGQFIPTNEELLARSRATEDVDALFFDADGDQDLDLYVARGSNEFSSRNAQLIDRLYFNDGAGNFEQSNQVLPSRQNTESTACVRASDIDQDGDLDLFVGVRLKTGVYGYPASSYLLENDGKGNFKDVTAQKAVDLQQVGMVTDAIWIDTDNDADQDLIIVGDWIPIKVFTNQKGVLTYDPKRLTSKNANGLWNCIEIGDFNADGAMDFVVGNHGQNSRLKATETAPITMYVNDFDKNRTAEQIISVPNNGQNYPLALRHDLVKQIPSLKKQYLYYKDYQGQKVNDIFEASLLQQAVKWTVTNTATSVALNDGKGNFTLAPLPTATQLSPIHAILAQDFDGDGQLDLLLGGNEYRSKPELGIYAASYGQLLKGNGQGQFETIPASASGFSVKGAIRALVPVRFGEKDGVLVGRNDAGLLFYEKAFQ